MSATAAGSGQVRDDVAVWVEQRDRRNIDVRKVILPTGLAQQALRLEHRWCPVVLVPKERVIVVHPARANRTGRPALAASPIQSSKVQMYIVDRAQPNTAAR